MNRTHRNARIIKIVKRTRDGSIHKVVLKKPAAIQPRVRIGVSIRKRKVSGNEDFVGASKRKRVRLSEPRSMNRIVLPYESNKGSTDKHILFFKTLPKLDA